VSLGSCHTKHSVEQLTQSDDFPSFISMIFLGCNWLNVDAWVNVLHEILKESKFRQQRGGLGDLF
jgi:hypothetical protein